MNQHERDEMAIRIAKRRAVRVEKELGGDQSKVRSFDVEDLTRDTDSSFPNRGQKSGTGRILPSRGTGLVETYRSPVGNVGPNIAPVGDNWLNGDEGEANANGGPAGGARRPLSGYVMLEPDVDARHEQNWPGGERGESGMAEPGVFRPTAPGDIGGTPKSSYVVKSVKPNGEPYGDVAQEILNRKTPLFKNIMCAPTRDPVTQAGDFLSSHGEAK